MLHLYLCILIISPRVLDILPGWLPGFGLVCAPERDPKIQLWVVGWWSAHRIRKSARTGCLLRPPVPDSPVGLLYVFDMSRGHGVVP